MGELTGIRFSITSWAQLSTSAAQMAGAKRPLHQFWVVELTGISIRFSAGWWPGLLLALGRPLAVGFCSPRSAWDHLFWLLAGTLPCSHTAVFNNLLINLFYSGIYYQAKHWAASSHFATNLLEMIWLEWWMAVEMLAAQLPSWYWFSLANGPQWSMADDSSRQASWWHIVVRSLVEGASLKMILTSWSMVPHRGRASTAFTPFLRIGSCSWDDGLAYDGLAPGPSCWFPRNEQPGWLKLGLPKDLLPVTRSCALVKADMTISLLAVGYNHVVCHHYLWLIN